MQFKPSITFIAVPQLAVVDGDGVKNSNCSSGFLQFPSLIPTLTKAASCCTKSVTSERMCNLLL